jgi:hypothetical protein
MSVIPSLENLETNAREIEKVGVIVEESSGKVNEATTLRDGVTTSRANLNLTLTKVIWDLEGKVNPNLEGRKIGGNHAKLRIFAIILNSL